MNYRARLEKLEQAMLSASLDGLVFGLGANFQYFTGSTMAWTREDEPTEPKCLLILSQTAGPQIFVIGSYDAEMLGVDVGIPVTIAQSRDEMITLLGQVLTGMRIGTSRQAIGYLSKLILRALPDAECVEAENLGEQLRVIKDADELVRLRDAAVLTDRVMGEMVKVLRPGITQLEVQQRIAEAGYRLGAQDISFPPAALFVKSGTTLTEDPFIYPKDEGLVPGTSIAFDFGFVLDGYCSDFGRSFYCGPAPEHIGAAYRALQEAQCHLISQMRPGMRIGDMPAVVLAKLDELGFGDRFRARVPDGTLGHQIGVDLHENPWLKPPCDAVLKPGMVMCIEPKLWLPGEYYLRVEDMVVVTENGAESLTNFDRNLFALL